MGRNYSKQKDYSVYVANILAKHYDYLKERLWICPNGNYRGRSMEDIFADTVIYVIQDKEACNLKTEAEILKHFEYRFNMIKFQVVKDSIAPGLPLDEAMYASYVTEW